MKFEFNWKVQKLICFRFEGGLKYFGSDYECLGGDNSTSVLLRILAVTLNSNLLIWDNADSSPDWEKVVEMLAKISDANRFKWDDFELDRNDPEKWKYVGNR